MSEDKKQLTALEIAKLKKAYGEKLTELEKAILKNHENHLRLIEARKKHNDEVIKEYALKACKIDNN